MTALPSTPTHAEVVMEMLSAAARVGIAGVAVEDIARRLYPDGRPAHYAESIRSTVQRLRKLLAERDGGIVFDGRRYALAIHVPGVFRAGAGFVRRPTVQPKRLAMHAAFAAGVPRRAGRG